MEDANGQTWITFTQSETWVENNIANVIQQPTQEHLLQFPVSWCHLKKIATFTNIEMFSQQLNICQHDQKLHFTNIKSYKVIISHQVSTSTQNIASQLISYSLLLQQQEHQLSICLGSFYWF